MNDDLRAEYSFDYSTAKPNRFANGLQLGGKLIILDPEMAAAFTDSNQVNVALRSVLRNSTLNNQADEIRSESTIV